MIAAINTLHRVVWGIGHTPAEARADAYKELATKSQALQDEGIEPLEFAELKSDADLEADGESMYHDIKPITESVQMGLNL